MSQSLISSNLTLYTWRVDPCSFCCLSPARLWMATPEVIAFACENPVADGHIVVAPRRHVTTIYELDAAEQSAVWRLVDEVRDRLTTGRWPTGVWVGMTDAVDEPASEPHEHIHLVPGGPAEPPSISGVQWSYVASGEYAKT